MLVEIYGSAVERISRVSSRGGRSAGRRGLCRAFASATVLDLHLSGIGMPLGEMKDCSDVGLEMNMLEIKREVGW